MANSEPSTPRLLNFKRKLPYLFWYKSKKKQADGANDLIPTDTPARQLVVTVDDLRTLATVEPTADVEEILEDASNAFLDGMPIVIEALDVLKKAHPFLDGESTYLGPELMLFYVTKNSNSRCISVYVRVSTRKGAER